ncbi:MAG: LysM peptidoglycan-binding domain-containing protein [Bacteroidetes bacterium]|nr:LysM peptidoglycan-binding domain-containing protein [Bacteroidota bacterium]
MNLIYFLRLLIKNIILIGGVGVLMAVLVYVMTRDQPESYSSEMEIYTGLATGYNIESGSDFRYDLFGTNAKFDNLLNIIRNRQTQEETAIRLMAQHLMLEQPDSRYCSKETWDAIQQEAPQEIKALVHRDFSNLVNQGYDIQSQNVENIVSEDIPEQTGETEKRIETRLENRQVTEKIKKYRPTPKYYTVKAGDYPVSIARKFSLSLEQLNKLNKSLKLPLHGGQRLLVGQENESYYVDTIVTKQVPIEVEVEVPVEKNTTPQSINQQKDPVKRMDSISDNFENIYQDAVAHVEAYQATVRNLMQYKSKDEKNYIYTTLQSSNPVYGISKISKVKVNRMQNSDLVKMSYESHDPGVCKQTLIIINEVYQNTYQSIKSSQTSMVSDYFRAQVNAAKHRLDSLEDLNLNFREVNRIINYNEQTKFIAEQNEVLDKDWYEESAVLSAAKVALSLLESELDEYAKGLTQRSDILRFRDDLGQTTRLIGMEEIKPNPNVDVLTTLKRQAFDIESQLEEAMDEAYQKSRTTEGIAMKPVLTMWLNQAIKVEESRARYNVKTQQKSNFIKKYDRFAPLGSELTKIERQINLAQEEYLDHWHSLSLSLMKQKNNEKSTFKTTAEAYFPIKPNPSKRMFMLIAAFMAGIVLTAGFIIMLEFIDNSIKFPERAEELTKSKLIGAYPRIPRRTDGKINYGVIGPRLIEMITQRIKLEEIKLAKQIDMPFLVLLMSTRRNEGKTYIGTKLVEKFRSVGHKVLYVKPTEGPDLEEYEENFRKLDKNDNEENVWDFEYTVPDNFMSIRSINELLRNFTFMTKGYQYIFLELPALLSSEYPAKLAVSADLSLLICRATRTWNKADDEVLNVFKANSKQTVFSMLNGTNVDNLEGIIGEIPKKRSWIRKFIKRVINSDLKPVQTF